MLAGLTPNQDHVSSCAGETLGLDCRDLQESQDGRKEEYRTGEIREQHQNHLCEAVEVVGAILCPQPLAPLR